MTLIGMWDWLLWSPVLVFLILALFAGFMWLYSDGRYSDAKSAEEKLESERSEHSESSHE
jgi:hypothetical protein